MKKKKKKKKRVTRPRAGREPSGPFRRGLEKPVAAERLSCFVDLALNTVQKKRRYLKHACCLEAHSDTGQRHTWTCDGETAKKSVMEQPREAPYRITLPTAARKGIRGPETDCSSAQIKRNESWDFKPVPGSHWNRPEIGNLRLLLSIAALPAAEGPTGAGKKSRHQHLEPRRRGSKGGLPPPPLGTPAHFM
ncbi:hypothetical protein AGIG_G19026 [Arapaima gigas]